MIKLMTVLFSIVIALFFSKNLLNYLVKKYPEYSMDDKYKKMIYVLSLVFIVLAQCKININLQLIDLNWVCHILISCLIGVLSATLSVSFIIDCLFQELPDENNFIIGLCIFPIGLYLYGLKVFICAIVLFVTFFIFAFITGQLGMGDVKMVFFMGLGFSLDMLMQFVFVSFFTASIYGIVKLIKTKCSKNQMFAFGPFLIVGFLSVIL